MRWCYKHFAPNGATTIAPLGELSFRTSGGKVANREKMKPIKASKALYIKLGVGGQWERDCIERRQTLRLGYREIPHALCVAGKWERVREEIRERYHWTDGVATNHSNQVKHFYESGSDVLWTTFFGDSLWWCFSKPNVKKLSDNTKTRQVIGKWNNSDVNGKLLTMNLLSGKLQSMQAFRGTVCAVAESDYLLQKINGIEPTDIREARNVQLAFERQIEIIIRRLHWKDFELLVDLIFRQAGWKRESVLGKSLKTVDMELISPITRERFGVQVKAKADLATFKSYQADRFNDLRGFSRFYFAVHTPSPDLEKAVQTSEEKVVLLVPADLAHLSIEYGLASWVIDKAQ